MQPPTQGHWTLIWRVDDTASQQDGPKGSLLEKLRGYEHTLNAPNIVAVGLARIEERFADVLLGLETDSLIRKQAEDLELQI